MRKTRRIKVDLKKRTKIANAAFDIQTLYLKNLVDLKNRKQADVVESDVTSCYSIKIHPNESENGSDSSFELKPHDEDSMENEFKSNNTDSEIEDVDNGPHNVLKSYSGTSLNKPAQQETCSLGSYQLYIVDENYDLPLWVSIIILSVYILLGAGMYSIWETNWSYLDAVYFVVMSLSTIGLGDFVPASSTNYLFLITSVYILFGLAQVAMVIHILLEYFARKYNLTQALAMI